MQESEKKATFRVARRDEEGRKREKKPVVTTHNPDTLRYIEKKIVDKGLLRLERHPADGIGLGRPPPKMGHGGKYTWEGPRDPAESELSAPPAIDEGDPNYVEEEGEAEDGAFVGVVEAAKVAEAKEGVSRVEIRPTLAP